MIKSELEPVFSSLAVIEIASALAGPVAGTFLMELGAKVIKIEPPHGDISRTWKISTEQPAEPNSHYFCAVNGNKTCRSVNLKENEGQTEIRKLLRSADILISNFHRRQSEKFKLTYREVCAINPQIIFANVTGFGPDDHRPAFDMLMQAACGLLSITGHKDQPPARIPIPIIDVLAGHQLKEAILCALLRRNQTGEGCEIQVSLFDSAISALTNIASNYLMSGHIAQPSGTQHTGIAPYGDIFITKDGQKLIMAIGSDQQFVRLCGAMQLPEVKIDSRFRTNAQRLKHRQELVQVLQDVMIKKKLDDWMALFQAHQLPVGPIPSIDQVLSGENARRNLCQEELADGTVSKRIRQAIFVD